MNLDIVEIQQKIDQIVKKYFTEKHPKKKMGQWTNDFSGFAWTRKFGSGRSSAYNTAEIQIFLYDAFACDLESYDEEEVEELIRPQIDLRLPILDFGLSLSKQDNLQESIENFLTVWFEYEKNKHITEDYVLTQCGMGELCDR